MELGIWKYSYANFRWVKRASVCAINSQYFLSPAHCFFISTNISALLIHIVRGPTTIWSWVIPWLWSYISCLVVELYQNTAVPVPPCKCFLVVHFQRPQHFLSFEVNPDLWEAGNFQIQGMRARTAWCESSNTLLWEENPASPALACRGDSGSFLNSESLLRSRIFYWCVFLRAQLDEAPIRARNEKQVKAYCMHVLKLLSDASNTSLSRMANYTLSTVFLNSLLLICLDHV